jgi:hypothetical protein
MIADVKTQKTAQPYMMLSVALVGGENPVIQYHVHAVSIARK